MELRGFEPLTFCMPCSTVSSDGVALGPVTAVQSGFGVWRRLAWSGQIWGRWHLVWSWFSGPSINGHPSTTVRITDDTMTLEVGELVAARCWAEVTVMVRTVRLLLPDPSPECDGEPDVVHAVDEYGEIPVTALALAGCHRGVTAMLVASDRTWKRGGRVGVHHGK